MTKLKIEFLKADCKCKTK